MRTDEKNLEVCSTNALQPERKETTDKEDLVGLIERSDYSRMPGKGKSNQIKHQI